MRRIIALSGLVLLACLSGCAREESTVTEDESVVPLSPVRFFREYVTVEPSHNSTRVSALYYFRNDSDKRVQQGIQYPFPVDRFHLYPKTIRVWEKNGEELRTMGFVRRDRHVLWNMVLEPREEKIVRVDYTQEIRRPRAVYIVTTTREWKRPIEVAEFEFRIPAGLDGVSLSFEPDRSVVEGDTTVHYVKYTDFMPDADMVATWTE